MQIRAQAGRLLHEVHHWSTLPCSSHVASVIGKSIILYKYFLKLKIKASFVQVYSEKITRIVEDISTLNLLEVADLNALLKARLNISDAPVMMAGSAPAAAQPKIEVGVLLPFSVLKKYF